MLEAKQQQGQAGQRTMSPAEPWDGASWKARGWKQAVTITTRVKKAQQQEGASVPACWERCMFWDEAVTAGGWHAAAVVCERELPLAAVVGSRALVIVCKRCFRKLVVAEHLLQVLSQKETLMGKSLFSSFASHSSLTDHQWFTEELFARLQPLWCIQSHSQGTLSAQCQPAAPGTAFPFFTFKMWFIERKSVAQRG